MASTYYPGMAASVHRALWQRAGLALRAAWQGWRQARTDRHRAQALRGLSCSTLRDVGLCDQLPPCRPTLSALDYQRGLW